MSRRVLHWMLCIILILSMPTATVEAAADGSGTLTLPVQAAMAGESALTLPFLYVAGVGGMSDGIIAVTLPAGWSPPSTNATDVGYSTAGMGSVSVSGQTITISNVTLTEGESLSITYGDRSGGGQGATSPVVGGESLFAAQQSATAAGTLAPLSASPSLIVYAADGSGSLTLPETQVSAGAAGQTLIFTYTAVPGGMSDGAISIVVPTGWSAPSTIATDYGYTTASAGSVTAAGQTIVVAGVTLAEGEALNVVYGDRSGGGPGATATTTPEISSFTAQQRSTAAGALTLLAATPVVSVLAADGGGAMAVVPGSVIAAQAGQALIFTYTAAGGMNGGTIAVTLPGGWSVPSTNVADAGYTTAGMGSVSVSGQTVTVSNVTLAAGETLTITYGDRSGGGPGATSPAVGGASLFAAQQSATAAGILTPLAESPLVTVQVAGTDGGGMLTVPALVVAAGQYVSVPLTYTAGPGGMTGGSISIQVPGGWSAPTTTANMQGYTSADRGTLSIAGQEIRVSGLTLAEGESVVVTYGAPVQRYAQVRVGSPGTAAFLASSQASVAGTLTPLAASPSLHVYGGRGGGTISLPPMNVTVGQDGLELTFTYLAPVGGMYNGALQLIIPDGWSAPGTEAVAAGYATATRGDLSVSGRTITVANLTLAEGESMNLVYGDRSGGGSGVAVSTPGWATFVAQQKSIASDSLRTITASPGFVVQGIDGNGTLTLAVQTVTAGEPGMTLPFQYTAAAGGMSGGIIAVTLPDGWSVPSTNAADAGYTTAGMGSVTVSGQTVTVSNVTLAAGETLTITYGDRSGGGPGATSPAVGGASLFAAQQSATALGTLTPLAKSPSVTVQVDGSGTLTIPDLVVAAKQDRVTVPLTYTAGPGGMTGGSISIQVPGGWSAPTTAAYMQGYTSADRGTLSIAGQEIRVSGLTLAEGESVVVTYGDPVQRYSQVRVGPPGTAVFLASSQASAAGTLTPLAVSPSLHVYGSRGSGTLSLPPMDVTVGQDGLELTFTYQAPVGGMYNGVLQLIIPDGWTAPGTEAVAAGYATATLGDLSVSGRTITVANLTLVEGESMNLVYGDRSGGGPGVAVSIPGWAIFVTQQKSIASDSLRTITASPGFVVQGIDGNGTLTLAVQTVTAGEPGMTLPFQYTAAAGGMSGGTIAVTLPSGWSAPSTNAADAGYTTAGMGSVTVSGQTVAVSNVTLADGETLTITYGDRSGGGPGATSPVVGGESRFAAQQSATVSGTLTPLAESPSLTVYAADGSGSLTLAETRVSAGQGGQTLVLTYTAAAGGMWDGSVSMVVPDGWSAPSTGVMDAGYTTANVGAVSASGQTIHVTGVTLSGGQSFTVSYGDRSGGGPGATATTTPGASVFTAQQQATAGGRLTALTASSTATVYAADGSGSLTLAETRVSAGQGGQTLVLTYTAAAGGMWEGSISMVVPDGWSAPSTGVMDAGYTTANVGTVSASGQTIHVTGVTLSGGQALTVSYGNRSGSGSGATATTTPGSSVFTVQQQATAGGRLTALTASPTATVYAADGSGSLTLAETRVSAGQGGQALVLTYTAAAGGMWDGSISMVVPAGWSAPSTGVMDAGYTTANVGTVSASGQTIHVTGVTLSGGQAFTVSYGDRSGGGPGVTATTTTGASVFTVQQQATAGGRMTALTASPSLTVYAADGSGSLTLAETRVSAGQGGQTLVLTYTAAAGGMSGGTIAVTLPSGWSVPSTNAADAGHTTAGMGSVSVSGQTVTVNNVTLAAGETLTITYGNRSGGGPGATSPTVGGESLFVVQQSATATGTLTPLVESPSLTVYAADGSGSLTLAETRVSAGQGGQTLALTYTAAAGGMWGGSVSIAVPAGWSAPSTGVMDAGYTTANVGSVSTSGQTIHVTGVALSGGQAFTVSYGDRSGGGPGATATTTPGASVFTVQQQATAGGRLTSLTASPTATVYAADGSGSLTLAETRVSAGQGGQTLVLTYTAAAGGMWGGSISIAVPAGWSAPSTGVMDAGYTTANAGAVSTSGQTIHVTGVTLSGGQAFTVSYGDRSGGGPGATAGMTPGVAVFAAQQQATVGGRLTSLTAAPSLTVYAADGSGSLTLAETRVSAGRGGQTLLLTYTAAAGGMSGGTISIAVPAGWSAPSTGVMDAGYTTANVGAVSTSGQTIHVTGVALSGGQAFTVSYGDRSGGGPGATATTTPGTLVFTAQQQATVGGRLTSLTAAPSLTVYAADGSGSLTLAETRVSAGQGGQTLVLTYTAAAGGMWGGSISITVPAGWSVPSTGVMDAGYTTANAGAVSTSGQTIHVTGVTLTGGQAFTVSYGNRSGGGPGATATTTPGASVFTVQQQATAGGRLTALTASPTATVYAPDGSGSVAFDPSSVTAGLPGQTLTISYTAAVGGTYGGAFAIEIPPGWSAPGTTIADEGYTTASTGRVFISGQLITVYGVTLATDETLVIVYGDRSAGGPGATPAPIPETVTFPVHAGSTSGGMTPLASWPALVLLPAIPSATVTPMAGRTPVPGDYFSLVLKSQSATAWSGPEWRAAGSNSWSSLGGDGLVTPGAPFTVTGAVPLTAGPYQVRVKMTNARGEVGYTQPIMMGAPYLGGILQPDGSLVVSTSAFNPGNWTVELTFRPTADTASRADQVLWSLPIDSSNFYVLAVSPGGRVHLLITSGGITVDSLTGSDPVLAAGQTYRIAIRGDGTKVAIFLDGVKLAAGDTTYTEPVGALPARMSFSAGTSQIRLFGRARSEPEIVESATGAQSWTGDPTCTVVELVN